MRHYGSLDTYFRVGLMTAGNLSTKDELAAIDDAIAILERVTWVTSTCKRNDCATFKNNW
jgi:hypothetical protein